MNKLVEMLEKIEAAPLGNARLEAIRKADSPDLRRLLNYSLSGDITFGIKQVPEATPAKTSVVGSLWFDTLEGKLLQPMASRDLTGNDAKTQIMSFLQRCDAIEAKWTERILKQDLRLSVGAKDVNKVLPGTIVVFSIPLAKPFKDLKSLTGRWALQPKMDGGRVVARLAKRGGPVTLLSRTGKEWKPFDDVKLSLHELNQRIYSPVDITLDGEVVVVKNGRMDFQAIQKIFHTDDGRAADGDVKYVLFDYTEGTEYDFPTMPYERRLNDLETILPQFIKGLSNIEIIKTVKMANPTKEVLDKVANEFVATMGCDGAIIRRLDKVPTNSKSSDITKVKPFEDGEALITGKVEGKGHLAGSLGTLQCKFMINKKPTGPDFEIGTGEGLTKELRQELWDDPKLAGKIVNFKYLRLSDDGVPQLPTYRAIRHPDDI